MQPIPNDTIERIRSILARENPQLVIEWDLARAHRIPEGRLEQVLAARHQLDLVAGLELDLPSTPAH